MIESSCLFSNNLSALLMSLDLWTLSNVYKYVKFCHLKWHESERVPKKCFATVEFLFFLEISPAQPESWKVFSSLQRNRRQHRRNFPTFRTNLAPNCGASSSSGGFSMTLARIQQHFEADVLHFSSFSVTLPAAVCVQYICTCCKYSCLI